MRKPVLIQYTMTFSHADSLPVEVVAAFDRKNGEFCPIVTQGWDYSPDHTWCCQKGYRPTEVEPGRDGRCRKSDWIVVDSHTFEPIDPDAPYRLFVVCTVEYSPIDNPRWVVPRELKLPAELIDSEAQD